MLSDITIGIKTFLRDDMLQHALFGIRRSMPEVKIIVADDGRVTEEKLNFYSDMHNTGNFEVHDLPWDSGFGKKSNFIADRLKTKYLLVGSDDFEFGTKEVRDDVITIVKILDENPYLDIVSGRVNNNPYEFWLDEEPDGVITEVRATEFSKLGLIPCDLTVNYSLIRQKVFENVRWDDEAKIGQGEHASFFLDVKWAGFAVAYAYGVNINEQKTRPMEEYRQYRNRARSPERSCFVKRGIKKYILGDGTVDYDETISRS
jgi:hypothetical protein